MINFSAILYILMWYGSICTFFICFNEFTLQQKVMIFMFISGIECLNRIISNNSS